MTVWKMAVVFLSLLVSLLVAVVAWLFTHLEQIEILRAWILRSASWLNRRTRLVAINAQIESRINVAAEAIESEGPGTMPYPLEIEWATASDEAATLADGQVVVRLRSEFNNARNIATAVMLYLHAGFLREARPHIDQTVMQALDLIMAWRLLGTHGESETSHYFLTEVYSPAVERNLEVESYCGKLRSIDGRGALTRVYARELRVMGRKLKGSLPSADSRVETRNFTDFFYDIIAAPQGGRVRLEFLGSSIRVAVQLVARWQTVAHHGMRVHRRRLRLNVQGGAETVYVMAIGPANVSRAQHLVQWGQEEGLVEIVREHSFPVASRSGTEQRAVVIVCHNVGARKDLLLDPEEVVYAALVRHVPQIAQGIVEVLDIAREQGVESKVVVRAASGAENPVAACAGEDRRQLQLVMNEVQESVSFIPWSDNTEVFLIDCLGIPHYKVVSVKLDPKNQVAEIIVNDDEIAAVARGKGEINIALAHKITGLMSRITSLAQTEGDFSDERYPWPERELRAALMRCVPDISVGSIRVLDCARALGFQGKVVVQDMTGAGNLIRRCLGKNLRNVDMLRAELGESVWFVPWSDDPEEFLVNCLGLKPDDVVSVHFNRPLGTAEVLVKDSYTRGKAVGESGINVKLAEQLTDLHRVKIRYVEE